MLLVLLTVVVDVVEKHQSIWKRVEWVAKLLASHVDVVLVFVLVVVVNALKQWQDP